MANIQINTTQNVNISFKLASIGERLLASVIDIIIIMSYSYIVSLILKYLVSSIWNADNWSKIAIISIFYLPIFLYTLLQEIFFAGQTLGKKVMKIRVVKIDGYVASFTDYFTRWIFRIPDIWFFFLVPIIGIITVIVSKNSQRFGGMASGTVVISVKNKYKISHTILENIDDKYKPTYPSVIVLSDNDMRIVKESFKKALKANDYKTITKLRKKVEEITQTKKEKKNDQQYLKTIIKDYTHYTQNM